MQEYIISAGKVEELQMIKDTLELDIIFERAKRVVVGGGEVILVRETKGRAPERFDSFTDLGELEKYRSQVYKFL